MPSAALLEQLARYERSIAKFNDVDAMVDLAYLLLYEPDIPKDVSRAFQLLERAIKQARHPPAMNVLAVYLHNNGNRQQRRRVAPLLEQSVKAQVNYKVLQNLANTLYRGECGVKDIPRAVQILQRAISISDDPQCMADLATIILKSSQVVGEPKYALNLYKRAIQLSDDASLMNNLGVIHMDGTVQLPSCDSCAAKWFERAIRTANLPTTKYNYASLLVHSNHIKRDPVRATQLLEQAVTDRPCEDFIVGLADIYETCEQVLDFPKAVNLYQRAYSDYESVTAMTRLINILAFGRDAVPVDLSRAYHLCKSYYRRTKQHTFLTIQACILWSGTDHVPRNPLRASKICARYPDVGIGALPLMIRSGAPNVPRNLKKAQRLSNDMAESNRLFFNALVLSETPFDQQKYQEAERIFQDVLNVDEEQLRDKVVWLPLCMRIGNITLPCMGDVDHVPNCIKRFEKLHDVSTLNLASIYLEQGMGENAVRMYESLMGTGLKDIAMINLGYVLRNGLGGVEKDIDRASDLFKGCVNEYNNTIAKAFLIDIFVDENNLSEDRKDTAKEVWAPVLEECREEEVHIFGPVFSEKWRRIVLNGMSSESFCSEGA
ncbi:unnamed protein product [Agarophyton chilense]|eukprot:gb/GEZJ01000904.1/.p1 GENE.gb/GEZJ01000904.1/~~gb/GEZJ01000904.1/.p1  ORF type:complete len:604 (-),score=94.81 gb/GEZJ01000904.1/:2360-4171(-)